MRILIYSINYAPEPTSTGKYAGELAVWLAARGHEVEAIAPLPHYPQWSVYPAYRGKGVLGFHRETLDGVRVLRCPLYVPHAGRRIGAFRRLLYEASFGLSAGAWFLQRLLTGRRYDVLIAICPPVQLGFWPWLYRVFRRSPWVFHIQDLQVDAAVRLGMLKHQGLSKWMYAFEGFMLRRASAVSTISEPMCQRLIERGAEAERAWLTPNWANLNQVQPGERNNDFRTELNLSDDQLLFTYAGNVGAKQGLEVVLEAADRLREDKRVCFAVIGSGAAQADLAERAKRMKLANVRLLPVQPTERLGAMLAAADVHLVIQRAAAADLVMPSKLTNILSAGRPCLATTESGTALASVLAQSGAGVICQPDDAAALAGAVRALADDQPGRRRMGYNARQYAQRSLDQEVILADFEAKLQALTASR